jgi:RES domain-containing protein
MFLWRISNHATLNGEGGKRASARWHTRGRPVVYLAASAAGALLETLVHLKGRLQQAPDTYTLLQIQVPSNVAIQDLSASLPVNWKEEISFTRRTGDAWLANGSSWLASMPSVVMPKTTTYLLNPLHPDAASASIVDVIGANHDPRLFS